MKKYILFGLITLITYHTFGQGNYKVKPSGSKGEFIIPPDSYWGYRESGNKKCGYDQYYYVLFYGLTNDYLKTISELYYTEYWSGNIDYFAKNKLPKHKNNLLNRKIKEQNAQLINLSSFKSTSTGKPFQCSPLDDKNSVYFIQIDYNSLLTGSREQIISNFSQLAKDLLIEISAKEGTYTWPTSISQNLVEKIFELIPIPQESSLARYGWNVTDQSSLLLLNPKISLSVEISSLSSTEFPPTDHWYYTLISQTNINFYRDGLGQIRQLPFIMFSNNTMPSNSFIGKDDNDRKDPNTLLLNNSGDMQLSQNSKSKHFVALFQDYMKQNSNYSTEGSSTVSLRDKKDRYAGNSIILLNDDINLLFKGKSETTNVKAAYNSHGYNYKDNTNDEKYSRTLITPIITIHLNSSPITIKLGSNISILNQQFNFGSHFAIYRSFNGNYVKIKNPSNSTILLPGDKIIF